MVSSKVVSFRVPGKYWTTLEALAAEKGQTPQEYLKKRSVNHLIGKQRLKGEGNGKSLVEQVPGGA